MIKKLDSIHPTNNKNSPAEKKELRLLLRTFYEEGRLKKLDESTQCVNQARWLWAAIIFLILTSMIGFIRLEFIATEQAKRSDAIDLIRYTMTHSDININHRFTKSQKNL